MVGLILPHREFDVYSSASGVVSETPLEVGSAVVAGQAAITLELGAEHSRDTALKEALVRSARAALLESELDVSQRTLALKRSALLSEQQLVGRADVEDAELSLRMAEARVAREENNLIAAQVELDHARGVEKRSNVKAPTSGTVTALYVRVGAQVDRQTKLLTIAELHPLRVRFGYLPGLRHEISRGRVVHVAVDGREFPAVVTAAGPELLPGLGLYAAEAELQTTDQESPLVGWQCVVFLQPTRGASHERTGRSSR